MYVLIFYIIILMLCYIICSYRKPQVMGKKKKGSGEQSEPFAKKPKEELKIPVSICFVSDPHCPLSLM